MDAMADNLTPAAELARHSPVRFPNESAEYRAARTALLAEEIELRRHIERVAEQRRALPPGGEVTGGLPVRRRGRAGAPSPRCSATSRRWSSTTSCTGRSASGPARCAPRCSPPGTARPPTSSSASRSAVVARSPIERLVAFKTRARLAPPEALFVDGNGDYNRDYYGMPPDGGDIPAFNVFTRRDGTIRHFWGGEMTGETADPGQDPRGAPDLMPLWTILDMTPEGRGTDWYPKLDYDA